MKIYFEKIGLLKLLMFLRTVVGIVIKRVGVYIERNEVKEKLSGKFWINILYFFIWSRFCYYGDYY